MTMQTAQLNTEKAKSSQAPIMPAAKKPKRWSVKFNTKNGVFHDVIDEDGQTVAKVSALAPSFGDMYIQGKVNATLTAHAPALNESLHEMLVIMDDFCKNGKADMSAAQIAAAERASNLLAQIGPENCPYSS